MSLDINKLKNVKTKGGKTTAQCPACAEDGHDSKGQHLVIYPDDKFACVAHPKDNAHQKKIFHLAGQPSSKITYQPTPIRIRKPACVTRVPKTLLILKSLVMPEAAPPDVPQNLERETVTVDSMAQPNAAAGTSEEPVQTGDDDHEVSTTETGAKSKLTKWHNFRLNPRLMVSFKDSPDVLEKINRYKEGYAKEGSKFLIDEYNRHKEQREKLQ